jgi:hypothetical protein
MARCAPCKQEIAQQNDERLGAFVVDLLAYTWHPLAG